MVACTEVHHKQIWLLEIIDGNGDAQALLLLCIIN